MAEAPADDDRTRTHSATAATDDRRPAPPRATLANIHGRDRYELIAEHGRGALGRVSRARDVELERDVAVKELITRTPLAELRFFREALITARLEHPGIVPVHEAGRFPDGTPFYAMKLVAGRPLRALIAERHTVEDRLGLLHHVIAVADAIAYAHDRNIIHRDLKPANVIVGDFGETVVIDWGIAKDLSAVDDDGVPGPSPSAHPSPELTTTGSILGTPAYMAPEQARGEHVDQRADVFAIGAMLWELCALEKDPPRDPTVRHPVLRRARIDRDLVTIIDKALDESPTRRYANAGELAADLKAFKAGARIAARTYTLPGLLRHWIRRHRTRAIAIAVAVVIAVAGGILYARDIAAEHAQTVAALARSEEDKATLILERAELQLRTDPTAAMATLRDYRGLDELRHAMLVAEATGRGVARLTARAHNENAYTVDELPDGSIWSIGYDHRIKRTTARGSETVVADVSSGAVSGYAPEQRLLPYQTNANHLALLDLKTAESRQLSDLAVSQVTIARDGTRIATADEHGLVRIWNVGPPFALLTTFPTAELWDVRFVSRDVVLVLAGRRAELHDLRTGKITTRPSNLRTIADLRDGLVALGQDNGTVTVMDADGHGIATGAVCKGDIYDVKLVPHRDQVVFGCNQDGGVAHYALDQRSLAVDLRFAATGPIASVTAGPLGDYVAYTVDQTAYLYDLQTKITKRFDGIGLIVRVMAPAGTTDLIASDLDGNIRVWDTHRSNTHMISEGDAIGVPSQLRMPDASALVAGTIEGTQIRLVHVQDGSTFLLQDHALAVVALQFAEDGKTMVSASWDGTARVWDTQTGKSLRVLTEHRGHVVGADFLPSQRRIVTAGDDGRILLWEDGARSPTTCVSHEPGWSEIQVMRSTGDIIASDAHNAVWLIASDCHARPLRPARADAITMLRSSRDHRVLAVGLESGLIEVLVAPDWHLLATFQTQGPIAGVAFHPTRPQLAVTSQNDGVYLFSLDGSTRLPWQRLAISSRAVAYSPDGALLAITTATGGTWFYALATRAWRYTQDHLAEIRDGQFTPDGKAFLSLARGGALAARPTATLFYPGAPP